MEAHPDFLFVVFVFLPLVKKLLPQILLHPSSNDVRLGQQNHRLLFGVQLAPEAIFTENKQKWTRAVR